MLRPAKAKKATDGKKKTGHKGIAIFFRPSPPRRSPGRHTVFAEERITHCIDQYPTLGSQKGARTITQSRVHPGV